jgi:hypothetical protein
MWMHNATTILGRWRLVKQKTFGGKIWSILFRVLFIGTTKVATHGGFGTFNLTNKEDTARG